MNRALHLIVMLGLVMPALTANAQTAAAEIISLQGKGEYRESALPTWRDATVRQKISEGNFVRTGDVSRMAILLADQTQIRLAANSMMQIKQVGDGKSRATTLEQAAGRSWTQSKNIPDKITVQTPSAMAAIRGTDWELVVAEDGTSTLTVLSGQVAFSNDKGSISINAGEQGRAQKGVAPVKTILSNPSDRVQWVSSFTVDPRRYPELDKIAAFKDISAQLRAGELAAAQRSLDPLLAQKHTGGTAHLLLADFKTMEGDIDAAIATLRTGADRHPSEERFHIWRARLHLLRDEKADARAAFAAARALNPRSAELMIAEGEMERMEGNAQAATDAYRSAIAGTSDSSKESTTTQARAWHGLGAVQTGREDVSNARESLNKALALDPQGVGFRGELGTLEAFADNLKGARAAFEAAIEQQPDDYVALTGLGYVELKSGNTDQAVTRLLSATLIEPRYARAQIYLAVAYYQLGRTKDALFALNRARELDPKDPLPDLFQSVIHNDLMQPGDAMVTARRALGLLPYLKSLNQIANDQKGSANLGSALAAFGMEDWARSYAQDSYYPFWAGSHLFLADRYSGDFNKKSELFQGFLSDPTVFGASNRFSTLVQRPGNYLNVRGRFSHGPSSLTTEPSVTVNGFANSVMPVAYLLEASRTNIRDDRQSYDSRGNTYLMAVGARPTYELGLFAYYSRLPNIEISESIASNQRKQTTGDVERLDLGANYRFGPESQAWLKIGMGRNTDLSNDVVNGTGTINRGNFYATVQSVKPEQRDLQFRHTFALNMLNELSWGAEFGHMEKFSDYTSDVYYHLPGTTVLANRATENSHERSRNFWVSNRFRFDDRLILQGDLAWQNFMHNSTIGTTEYQVFTNGQVIGAKGVQAETLDRSVLAPRVGASYAVGSGATLRGAYQKWLRPASFSSLMPVATAGIPVDESLAYPGGTLSRIRGQLDWELSPAWFVNAFADRRSVDNLVSEKSGVLNTRQDVSNLFRLRQSGLTNLVSADLLEQRPIFSSGVATSAGFSANHVISRNLAGSMAYSNTASENTSAKFRGKEIPYLPKHRAAFALIWTGDNRFSSTAQAVWRSSRFSDEANLLPMGANWDMQLGVHWESEDKRWNADVFALNLFNNTVEKIIGVLLTAKF
ncbi:FecR domain-containing protein [soil metagenome]